MIYITGDCHRNFSRFNMENFPEQKTMTRKDYVIICGDFGAIWDDSEEEKWWLKWLSEKTFTILFVCGNHENFQRLYSEFPVIDFHGGKAHRIRENIFHLMRGYVFHLCGRKFFAFGGASSHDIEDGILSEEDFENRKLYLDTIKEWNREGKRFRIEGKSWWKQELPSLEEMNLGERTLAENGFKVDYVISHCLPQSVVSSMLPSGYKMDCLTAYFNRLLEKGLQFKGWWCGHYHLEADYLCQFHIRYKKLERLV